MSDLFFEDKFDRADSTTVGNSWQTTGALQIVDGNLRQSGASSTTNAFALLSPADTSSALGKEMIVGAIVACDDDTSERQFDLILRASDNSVTDAYWVSLNFDSDVATLKIIKRTGSSNTTAESKVVTDELEKVASSYDSVYQRLSARIIDEEASVKIQVYLNDEETPILTATDTTYPLHRTGAYFGLRFSDNDNGSDGHLFCESFFAQAIIGGEEDFAAVAPAYWTLGNLIAASRAIALRDSKDGTDGKVWRELLNMAQAEVFDAVGTPDWSEQVHTFIMASGQTSYELPAWVDSHDNTIRLSDGDIVSIYDEGQWRRESWRVDTDTGTPYVMRMGGRGPAGGLLLIPYPIPSEDITMEIRVRRAPGLMEVETDQPSIPQSEAHYLVAGAVHLYAMSDNSRTAISAWSMKWETYLRRAKKRAGRRKTLGRHGILRPGLRHTRGASGWSGRSW